MKKTPSFLIIAFTLLFVSYAFAGSDKDATTNKDLVITIVELKEFEFVPKDVAFKVWRPTKLILKNTGSTKHYFVSEGFFASIWVRKVQTDAGEVKLNGLTALEVFPGKEMEIYFTPLKIGKYDLRCTIKGHKEKGMIGAIEIKE